LALKHVLAVPTGNEIAPTATATTTTIERENRQSRATIRTTTI